MALNTLMSKNFHVLAPCFNVLLAFIFKLSVRVCADEFREEFLRFPSQFFAWFF